VYKAKKIKQKKLFGIFQRQVEADVELDDTTGEITEKEVEPTTPFERMLNFFSR
jgi:hypothetical protein